MRLLVLLLASLVASKAVANTEATPHPNERDYIIEVLIFSQQPGKGSTELPGKPHTFSPLQEPALQIGPSPAWSQLTKQPSGNYLPQEALLVREADALKRNKDYRLLFHETWRMRLVSEDRSLPLLIEGGDYYDGMPELQGKLKLSVARYLHLETDLFLNTFEPLAESNQDTPLARSLHPLPLAEEQLDPSKLRKGSSLVEGQYKVKDSAGMHQRRRMRSGDLHFIDSPYLGLLIKIERAPE
ncbi:CsiV family protein [Marinospirillum insulare]|uniref:Peptidoglycan-binding protein, CsiV n=1 Tax=Marinospirillum insulare TaxID=217169 RepID=A0ABQ5ZWZ8_9GAMM|nr:CsiV family protein [Marinospirillum insulare]GLR64705.1 hypothetical protein GCM10007878_21430 [Marinospirillum insulare]